MEKNSPHQIYVLVNPRNHLPFYVGITTSLEARYEQHLGSKDGKKRAAVIANLAENGLKPAVIVLEQKQGRREARFAEVFWIELFKSRGIPIVNKEVEGGVSAVEFHSNSRLPKSCEQATASDGDDKKPKQFPANHGKAWSETDVAALENQFEYGATIEQLTTSFARTRSGILGQLNRSATAKQAIYSRLADLGLLKSQEAYHQSES